MTFLDNFKRYLLLTLTFSRIYEVVEPLKIDKIIKKSMISISHFGRNSNDFYRFQLKIDKNHLILSIFNGTDFYRLATPGIECLEFGDTHNPRVPWSADSRQMILWQEPITLTLGEIEVIPFLIGRA